MKELIITKGGENIAPVPIERQIRELTGNVPDNHFILIGDDEKFLSMLVIVPNEEAINDEKIKEAIIEYNKKAMSGAQKIQKYTKIIDVLTPENGLMTPTMKYKRKIIEKKYSDKIQEFYK